MVCEDELLSLPWFPNENSYVTAQHLLACILNA